MRYIIFVFFIILVACNNKVITTSKKKEDLNHLNDSNRLEYQYAFTEATKNKLLGNYKLAIALYRECIKINPLSAASYYELSNLAIMNNDPNYALKFSRKAFNIESSNQWYNLQLAKIYMANNQIDSSIYIYNNLIKYYPDKSDFLYNLSMLQKENKDYKKAINTLNKLEKIIGFREHLYVEREKLYVLQKDYKKADKEIQKLIDKNPENYQYYGILAEMYDGIDDTTKSNYYYRKVFELSPNNGIAHISMAESFKRRLEFDNYFESVFKAFQQESYDPEQKVQYFLGLIQNKEFYAKYKKNILGLLNILLSLYPNNYSVQALYADYLIKEKKEPEALKQLRKVHSLDTTNYLVSEQLLIYENIYGKVDSLYILANSTIKMNLDKPLPYLFSGLACLQMEKYEEGSKVLELGLEKVGENNELKKQFFTYLGELYHNLGKYYRSDLYFEKLLVLDPNNVMVLNNYAYYLSVRNEHLDKALKMSKKTIDSEPNNSTYLDTYAWILYQKGEYDEAKIYMSKALNNSSEASQEMYDHFGDILFQLKKYNDAYNYWLKAKDLGKDVDEKLKKLEQIRNK